MARLQWCRDHIDDVKENCEIGDAIVKEVKLAAAFCDEHLAFANLPTRSLRPLIRIKDAVVKDRAISWAKNALNKETHVGKNRKETLTEKEIKKVIEDIEIEVRNEKINADIAKENAEEERSGIKNITQDEVDAIIDRDTEPEKDPEPVINKQGNQIYSDEEVEKIKADAPPNLVIHTIMQYELDLYFEVMEKIGCKEDIEKHKKRMSMMIENKTLLITG